MDAAPPYRSAPRSRVLDRVPGAFDAREDPSRPGTLRLEFGADVGFAPGPDLGYWLIDADVIARDQLDEALCRDVGLVLPHAVIDAARWPQVHRAACAARLIALGAAQAAALRARSRPVITVANNAKRDYFLVSVHGGASVGSNDEGRLRIVDASATGADDDTLYELDARFADRIVRTVTADVACVSSLQLACDLRDALREREAPDAVTDAAAITRAMALRLDAWEAWLAAVVAAGGAMQRDVAQAHADVCAAIAGSSDAVAIAGIGAARRVTEPAVVLEQADASARHTLPAEAFVVVDDATLAQPPVGFSPPELAMAHARRRRPWLAFVVLLAVCIAVALIARRL